MQSAVVLTVPLTEPDKMRVLLGLGIPWGKMGPEDQAQDEDEYSEVQDDDDDL
jgi:hypothetical protein